MFEVHLNDLIENSMNDESANSNKSSPAIIKKKIQHSKGGLKDLIIHPNSSGSGSSPIITTPSNSSSGSSTPKTSISTLSSQSTNKTKTANSSTIKSTKRKDQSLRETLEDWRSEFYPDLAFDDFNLNNNNSNSSNNKQHKSKSKDLDDIDTIDEEEEVEDDQEDSSNEYSDSSSSSSDNNINYNKINYYEYLENNMLNEKDEDQDSDINQDNGYEASTNKNNNSTNSNLLEQRVKQWMNDIHFDIEQSSKIFIHQLPQLVLEPPLLSEEDSDLPMTPSTKESPNPNIKSKSKFDLWRENFNKSMDEQMLEKKRTNKITITSNK